MTGYYVNMAAWLWAPHQTWADVDDVFVLVPIEPEHEGPYSTAATYPSRFGAWLWRAW